jgi:hypothetical protein
VGGGVRQAKAAGKSEADATASIDLSAKYKGYAVYDELK